MLCRTLKGLRFEGDSYVTIQGMTRFSLTLVLWLNIDSDFSSLRQQLVSCSGSSLAVEIEPAAGMAYFNQHTLVYNPGMFGKAKD